MKEIQKTHCTTGDGSPTLYMAEFDEYYHSKHGAVQEALHVYIEKGLKYWQSLHPMKGDCRVFEMGFGTGLNAFLTAETVERMQIRLIYDSIEAFPLDKNEHKEVSYFSFFEDHRKELFKRIIESPWEQQQDINPRFFLKKIHIRLQDFAFPKTYDVIYFDAFGARTQPELWIDDCFTPMVEQLNPGGVFVTYSAKGSVRRALEKLGLLVTLEPGPPGKREMIRAIRPLL